MSISIGVLSSWGERDRPHCRFHEEDMLGCEPLGERLLDQQCGDQLGKTMIVSIITVVRNERLRLAKTIDSVRSQSHRLIEFIVIDGDSDDGTVAVIRSNEDIIDDWESQPDDGIYDAMNKGLRHATGEFKVGGNKT